MRSKRRKIHTIEHAGLNIREIRPDYFMVDYMQDGKRHRQCFSDLAAAKNHCAEQALKISHEGSSVLGFSSAQREDARRALAELDGKASLLTAVKFWKLHNATEDGVTVRELGRRWLANLRAQGCRETTIREREYKVESIAEAMGDRQVASVTRDDLAAWITGRGVTGSTWDTYRRTVRAMFQFATNEKILEFNPAAAIKPVRLDERLPTPLSVEAVTAIMRAAEKYAPIMVPTLAVQFFGGLRPGEAMGLDWTAIDFKQKLIRVSPEVSKVRRSRIVEMNQTLIDWLTPYRKIAGKIGIETKSQFSFYMLRKSIGEKPEDGQPDKRKPGIVTAAGVKWIQDGPRKTFASMHYATHGDAAKLASILGHTGGHDVLFRHYRGLATKADARKYWKIRPSAAAGKVLIGNFEKAAG
jgi:integrase